MITENQTSILADRYGKQLTSNLTKFGHLRLVSDKGPKLWVYLIAEPLA